MTRGKKIKRHNVNGKNFFDGVCFSKIQLKVVFADSSVLFCLQFVCKVKKYFFCSGWTKLTTVSAIFNRCINSWNGSEKNCLVKHWVKTSWVHKRLFVCMMNLSVLTAIVWMCDMWCVMGSVTLVYSLFYCCHFFFGCFFFLILLWCPCIVCSFPRIFLQVYWCLMFWFLLYYRLVSRVRGCLAGWLAGWLVLVGLLLSYCLFTCFCFRLAGCSNFSNSAL